ncbi:MULTISPECIES: accessory Sec system S-layer assembly protein [unclassified Lysinibacillus]|uniref:accessory Sec system S-layer assembly protein n=1 Tax=unclassified Lysinibacillus TaxID=2636778 RepID=UPI002012DB73|nr:MULTISPECIES: accessory Sec system S-layer assembly protein [unclassified Lysinibacillus]MCL1695839.1 accessory Sec system S-layer assembly protein [Lysinibacillus sp. BPa_S21]MCL1699916.1 accessory Sec system S-layer assembly protein [Lysinibacillus sp. Bpr_S20]
MGLFSFFKKSDKLGQENTIDSKDLLQNIKVENTNNNRDVVTKLSYHPDWEVPQEQKYIFNFLANELEPLKPNQLSLSSISIEEDKRSKKWQVRAFFRSSLPQAIELGEIELFIMDKNDELVASKTFDFAALGTIPAESARPWVFDFEKSTIKVDKVPEDGWKIAFNLVSLRGHQLELDPSWEKQLPAAQKEELANIVKTLPKLGETEVNFTGLQAKLADNGNLNVSIFIRNGHNKAINLEQLPLEIIDATGKQIAKGSFKMDPILTVQPNSTKPWTFIFPAELVDAKDADLSRWTARVTQ